MKNENIERDISRVFDNGYICGKQFFLFRFGKIPSINYIGQIDGEKSFNLIKEKYEEDIESIHTYRYYETVGKKYGFGETFIVMKNGSILEFDKGYCEIYYCGNHDDFISELTTSFQRFKERQRRKPLEINLISNGRQGFELQQIEVKRTKLDMDLFYENDFKEVHNMIYKRLSNQKDKGIVLLHGLPGTGKTTYLRYLIGKVKKRVLFISPEVAGQITNPEFIKLLIANPNSILIIEDAENVIMDRTVSNNASVSNLLNISDGLLADFLNVQLICTFNNSLTMVDSALLRKGRLIAKYEFGKLGIEKAQQLSNHLGHRVQINRPMTVAEIANPGGQDTKLKRNAIMGFRREQVLMN